MSVGYRCVGGFVRTKARVYDPTVSRIYCKGCGKPMHGRSSYSVLCDGCLEKQLRERDQVEGVNNER